MFDTLAVPELLYFAVLVIGAAFLVKSGLVKQNRNEVKDLAETRGETIDDLREEMVELREHMTRLEGKLVALEELKVQQIIDGVVDGLTPFLEA